MGDFHYFHEIRCSRMPLDFHKSISKTKKSIPRSFLALETQKYSENAPKTHNFDQIFPLYFGHVLSPYNPMFTTRDDNGVVSNHFESIFSH